MRKFESQLKTIKFKIVNNNFFNRKNKIILNEDNCYNNATIKFSNRLILAKEDSDIETMSDKVKNFLSVMNKECKNFDSTRFFKNFKKTLFNISAVEDKHYFKGNVYSDYKGIKFTIDNFRVTSHELMHLSTIDKDKGLSGFKQSYLDDHMGRGLNEGYTQLLTERYFNETVGESYPFLVFFSNILEKIIGKDNMEKYYFELSLSSLISDLEKYEDKENILDFIDNLDLLNDNDIADIDHPEKEQFIYYQDRINDICDFLLSCLQNKIKYMLSHDLELNLTEELNCLYNITFPRDAEIKYNNGLILTINLFNQDKVDEIKQLTKKSILADEPIQNKCK